MKQSKPGAEEIYLKESNPVFINQFVMTKVYASHKEVH